MKNLCLLLVLFLLAGQQAFSQPPARTQKEAKERVELAYKRVKAGESFAQVAKQLSDDPATAAVGGELGWFERDELNSEFGDEIAKLKVNEISQPFLTRFGYHVAQVLEKKGNAFHVRHILIGFTE